MTEKEKFEMLLEWLKGVKSSEVESFDEDNVKYPFRKEDVELLYDEIIAIVESVRDGVKVVAEKEPIRKGEDVCKGEDFWEEMY